MSVSNFDWDTTLRMIDEGYRSAHEALEREKDLRAETARMASADGLSNREIAEAWGLTEGAVRQMLKRPTAEWIRASLKPASKPECSVDGCSERIKARGLCPTHYQRWRGFDLVAADV